MRIAVIGLGVIGKVHIKVIKETDNELVAVCDTDQKKLSVFSEIAGYTDYLQMLDEVRPDIVHICTPHHCHTQMILESLKRNINVLCEKPICIRKEDISLILEAEKASNAQLGVCFQNRYNPTTVFAREFLKDRKICSCHGELKWRRDKTYYEQDAWRGKKQTEGGGVLINQALHTIDLLHYFCGMPKSVMAVCENRSLQGVIDVEDTATLAFYGKNNATMYATNSADKDYPVMITIRTEEDELRVLADGIYVNGEYKSCETDVAYYGKKIYGVGHRALIYDFYDCIQSGRKFAIDGKEAVKAVKIVLAAYESEGEEIRLC
jgi:predicted dehydrogenase